jgi:DNA topoisomerase-1
LGPSLQLLDPGFLRVYDLDDEPKDDDMAHNEQLPPLAKGDELACHRLIPEQHFTKPPPYFTDATLIQELERLGIGRPSTFASIVDTLYQRDYVAKVPAGRGLRSTELGRVVCDFLVGHFLSVFEVGFTARLEDQLDDIANGEAQWTAVMAAMWTPLSALVAQAQAAMAGQPKIRLANTPIPSGGGEDASPTQKRWRRKGKSGARRSGAGGKKAPTPAAKVSRRSPATPTGQTCPECGKPLVNRTGKFGPFIGCSGFPKCRYVAEPDRGTPGAIRAMDT